MTLVVPEILSDCTQMSLATNGFGLLIGLLLWLLGGYGHRFCIVMVTTLVAGVIGLQMGPPWGLQPLVAGLMLAVAAGALALSLVRVAMFAAVGFGALALAKTVAPQWDEPVACFLGGGLLGVLLFRFWIVVAASLGGTLLMAYSGLTLLGKVGKADVMAWAQKNGPLLNWACLAVMVLGILVQLLVQRKSGAKSKDKPKDKPAQAAPAPPPAPPPPPPPPPKTFWQRMLQLGEKKKAA